MRAGSCALTLLGRPLDARIMLALAEGPRRSERLREAVGEPPGEELRAHLKPLTRHNLLVRSERGDALGTVDYDLAPAGKELLRVGEVLAAWLRARPKGAIELGSPQAMGPIEALIANWERITAAEPASPSDWMRRGVAPLSAGAAWERRHLPHSTAPIERQDVEAAFLLAVPLLRLRPECSGAARLAVELPGRHAEPIPAGVLVSVEEGRIAGVTPRLAGAAGAWALGSARAWLTAVIEGDVSDLRIEGDEPLATELVWGLHGALFGSEVR